ncbi:MAG: glycoside hydrolase family 99-like domain-containing protein [Anaerolineaceae bacterium]|nr:glycoside hydrolase family 99-like domain-containing protein [Anaerolineaceae bacterium]
MLNVKPRLIAFYLPQYHPIPENDEWWGKGFTEWTNVTKAKPLFKGHYQPHIPADLGFYDLRVPETRQAQADMAREYGIHGFCYYHYWFNGKRMLERPFQEVLESGEPDLPFCLCWANENWTRTWDGKDNQILINQNYSEKDDLEHIRALIPSFMDPRYIRHDEKPLMLIYRAGELPDPKKTTDIWRNEVQRAGIGDLFLCKVESNPKEHTDPGSQGFDAALEFQPDWGLIKDLKRRSRIAKVFAKFIPQLFSDAYLNHKIIQYQDLVNSSLEKEIPNYTRFPCVTPRWDNSARKQVGATIITGSTPEKYQSWLIDTYKNNKNTGARELIFINAWNEWAEGNYLEPDMKFGHDYLVATKNAIDQIAKESY